MKKIQRISGSVISCMWFFCSEAVVNQIQNCVQISRIHLTGGGSLADCTKRAGAAKDFSAQTADKTCAGHGHGNDGAVRIICCHLFSSGKENQNILLVFGHNGNLGDIRAQILHLAESADNVILFGCLAEIMVGSHDLNACGMCAGNDLFDNVIPCKGLDVDQVDQTGLCCLDIEFCIYFSGLT